MTSGAPDFELHNKVCVVTGSTRGLGKSIAIGMGHAGARIVINGRSEAQTTLVSQELESLGIEASGCALDVTDRQQCQKLIDTTVNRFGRLDVMVANHGGGIVRRVPALEESETSWSEVLNLNLSGAFHCCQLAARQMKEQNNGGAIIVVSSTSAHIAHPNLLAYGAAKAGVNQMVRQFAYELGSYGIRVNSISPGFTTHRPRAPEINPESDFDKKINDRTPLGRSGEPHEFAGPVVFLASDASSYITGINIPVDGGYMIA